MLKRAALALLSVLIVCVVAFFGWPEADYHRYEPDPAYMRQAAAYDIPAFPDGWSSPIFTTADGTRLRWGETANRDTADVTVVLVPGYTATLDMYGEHVAMLQARGYHVMGVDLRGQGMSERHRPEKPEKMYVRDFSVYSDDLAEFISMQAPQDRPIVPIAMSFGGHVALRMAVEHPGVADGLFLVAPAIVPKAGGVSNSTMARIARVAKALGRGERYLPGQQDWRPFGLDYTVASIELCASEPRRLWLRDAIFAQRPEQRVGGVTAQWGLKFLESSDELMVSPRLSELETPTHMVQAAVDTFVENDAITNTCGRMVNCRTAVIPQTGHCLLQENDDVLSSLWDALDRLVSEADLGPDRRISVTD